MDPQDKVEWQRNVNASITQSFSFSQKKIKPAVMLLGVKDPRCRWYSVGYNVVTSCFHCCVCKVWCEKLCGQRGVTRQHGDVQIGNVIDTQARLVQGDLPKHTHTQYQMLHTASSLLSHGAQFHSEWEDMKILLYQLLHRDISCVIMRSRHSGLIYISPEHVITVWLSLFSWSHFTNIPLTARIFISSVGRESKKWIKLSVGAAELSTS